MQNYLPMNAAALMDRVFDLYKATFKMQIAFSLIIGIISFILMMILGIAMVVVTIGAIGITAGVGGVADEYAAVLMAVTLVLLGMLPLYMAWIYLSASGHILISKQAFYGEVPRLPFRELFSAFLRIMSAGLAQIILSLPWVAVIGVMIYFAVAGYGDAFEFIFMIPPWVLVVGSIIYALLYIVYSNIFALSIPAALFEGRVFFGSIVRSLQLMRGDFWRILGLRLLWALLVFLFSYSAQGLVVGVVGILAHSAGTVLAFAELWAATGILQFYASLAVSILVGPMEGIMTALIYFNQRIKKDGLDIEIGLSQL